PGPGAAWRVRRRRALAALQGHSLALQIAVQAAAGGGLRQSVSAATLPGAGLQTGHLSRAVRSERARPVYRCLPCHRALPRRARRPRTPGAGAALPVPEDQSTAEPAAGQPQQELAAQPARAADPRLALGRAAVRTARQPWPLESAS